MAAKGGLTPRDLDVVEREPSSIWQTHKLDELFGVFYDVVQRNTVWSKV